MTEVAVITIPIEEWKETKSMIVELLNEARKLTSKNESELLTIPEVRERLSVSASTMERYINSGAIEVVRPSGKDGGKRYVKRSELERKISDGTI